MRFDLLRGVGEGVGDAFLGLEAVGDGVGVGFFIECFRCLRDGIGVGSGSRTFLILVPNDSSAEGAALTAPNKIARIRNHFILDTVVSAVLSGDSNPVVRSDALRQRTLEPTRNSRALAGLLYSDEYRLQSFREENFR